MAGQLKGLRVAVTGACGFIGRAVVQRVESGALGAISELLLNDVTPFEHPGASTIFGSFADALVKEKLIEGGIDVLFHLASLPGGSSEAGPALGKVVNLDGSLALIDAIGGTHAPVVVYTSSIAALGRHQKPVSDQTALRPNGSYGTHKAMVELYLADMTRRGLIDARSVRPSGIVARPLAAFTGFATAWMSDLFHAAHERRAINVPTTAASHIWLQSIDCVADNIIHAAKMIATGLPPHRVWTLPASVVRIDALVDALSRHTGFPVRVNYGESGHDHPPLNTDAALAAGFIGDGDVDALVDNVMSQIEQI